MEQNFKQQEILSQKDKTISEMQKTNLSATNSLFDQKSLIQEAETNIVRACFVILISKTDKLNKIEGCEKLVPLPSVITKDKPIIM